MKVKRAEKFLKAGGKVKLSVMFRGREIVHPEIGRGLLERARDNLKDVAVVEKPPTMEGRFMNMILGPQTAKAATVKPAKPATSTNSTAPQVSPPQQAAETAQPAEVASEG
jgi:translation initiation factor IF-3